MYLNSIPFKYKTSFEKLPFKYFVGNPDIRSKQGKESPTVFLEHEFKILHVL